MRIGTRGSALALWQARTVARLIEQSGGPTCAIVVIRTSGDESPGPPDSPREATETPRHTLTSPGTEHLEPATSATAVKRLFVKEIEEALLEGRVDLAVHSGKDLPAVLPDGLRIAGAIAREDPRDALVLPGSAGVRGLDAAVAALGRTPTIGTSSVRRAAELKSLFPSATFTPVRGNVDTRLRRLDAGECNALILAVAGLTRLGLDPRISAPVPVDICVPAPGQGIVAIEIADTAHEEIRRAIAAIGDADAITALIAERAVVQAVGGGCQMPLGVLADLDGQTIALRGSITAPDGSRVIRATMSGNRGNPAAVGDKLAAELLRKGAGEILARLRL
jgi:hydroxymethylbilane synthase